MTKVRVIFEVAVLGSGEDTQTAVQHAREDLVLCLNRSNMGYFIQKTHVTHEEVYLESKGANHL